MRTLAVVVLAVIGLVGCTPGMHKAWQYTMASVATVGFTCDAMQTNAAVNDPSMNFAEANVLNGRHPGTARLAAVAVSQSALAFALPSIPNRGEDSIEYLKDAAAFLPVLAESLAVYGNSQITGRPMSSCGQ